MATSRTPAEIEKDITNIDHALITVSEIRSSLRHFVDLIQSEQKGPTFVHSFNDRLKTIRTDLNTLSAESENLKVALEHAQVAARENKFNWDLIKSEAEKEAIEEELRYREEEENSNKAKEIGSMVRDNADRVYKELVSIVLERKPNLIPSKPLFFTEHINEWITKNKATYPDFTISFESEEQTTIVGSTCRIRVCSRKALAADLELEYEKNTDTLIIHQYDIKSVKEQKHFWQDSQYLVFQKLNLLATSAFEHMLVFYAKESLHNILDWFASYYDLFSKPCHRCHKLLQFDSPHYKYLPPMVRTWTKKQPLGSVNEPSPLLRQEVGVAYHMRCFAEYQNSHSTTI